MPAGNVPERERRSASSFIVDHATDPMMLKMYGRRKTRPLKRKRSMKVVTETAVEETQDSTETTPDVLPPQQALLLPPPPPQESLQLPPPQQEPLTIVTIVGERLQFPYDPTMTFGALQRQVDHVYGIPVPTQRYFQGITQVHPPMEATLDTLGWKPGVLIVLANIRHASLSR